MIKNKIGYCIVSLFIYLLFTGSAFSQQKNQNYLGKNFFTNISGSYILEKENFYHRHNEFTINIQVGIQIIKPLFLGVETISVFTNGTSIKPANYFIKGGYIKYEFLQLKKIILFINTSLLNGDYCTCGDLDPYRKSNLYYLGIESGGKLYIAKSSFSLNVSLSINKILNNIPSKYNFNIYKLGIGYSFGKDKNS